MTTPESPRSNDESIPRWAAVLVGLLAVDVFVSGLVATDRVGWWYLPAGILTTAVAGVMLVLAWWMWGDEDEGRDW